MSGIVKVASWSGKPRASVIFVHGPGGEAYDTWRRAPDDHSFWPLWLAEDIAGSRFTRSSYEAPASNWLGTAMPLQDRAFHVPEILLGIPGLTDGHLYLPQPRRANRQAGSARFGPPKRAAPRSRGVSQPGDAGRLSRCPTRDPEKVAC